VKNGAFRTKLKQNSLMQGINLLSLNSKQSFINGVNKPFMGLFLLSWYLYDTCFDSTTDIYEY